MRTPPWILAVTALALAAVACSAAPPSKKKSTVACKDTADCLGEGDGTQTQEGDQADGRTVNGSALSTPSQGKDGGGSTPPPPALTPCEELSKCCANIAAYADQIACEGFAITKQDASCAPALSLCKTGGYGIHDLAEGVSDLSLSCAKLSGCCGELKGGGYDTTTCEGTMRGGDASVCRTRYDSYKQFGDCR